MPLGVHLGQDVNPGSLANWSDQPTQPANATVLLGVDALPSDRQRLFCDGNALGYLLHRDPLPSPIEMGPKNHDLLLGFCSREDAELIGKPTGTLRICIDVAAAAAPAAAIPAAGGSCRRAIFTRAGGKIGAALVARVLPITCRTHAVRVTCLLSQPPRMSHTGGQKGSEVTSTVNPKSAVAGFLLALPVGKVPISADQDPLALSTTIAHDLFERLQEPQLVAGICVGPDKRRVDVEHNKWTMIREQNAALPIQLAYTQGALRGSEDGNILAHPGSYALGPQPPK